MFDLSLSFGAFLYTIAACLVVFGLWIYYDARDRRLYEAERRKTTFHCIRCDKLYSAHENAETCPCPRCSFRNQRLTF